MSGKERISGWTVDTLKEHIDSLLEEHDKRYAERFAAQERAVNLALQAKDRSSISGRDWVAIAISMASALLAIIVWVHSR